MMFLRNRTRQKQEQVCRIPNTNIVEKSRDVHGHIVRQLKGDASMAQSASFDVFRLRPHRKRLPSQLHHCIEVVWLNAEKGKGIFVNINSLFHWVLLQSLTLKQSCERTQWPAPKRTEKRKSCNPSRLHRLSIRL